MRYGHPLTNIISLFIVLIGYFSPIYSDLIFITGLFAFSGGITNWLAVHMLFEKIPFLYGSGVIPNRFEEFKSGIKQLVIQEFFSREHIDKFFQNKFNNSTEKILKKIDFDRVFEGLASAIESSSNNHNMLLSTVFNILIQISNIFGVILLFWLKQQKTNAFFGKPNSSLLKILSDIFSEESLA